MEGDFATDAIVICRDNGICIGLPPGLAIRASQNVPTVPPGFEQPIRTTPLPPSIATALTALLALFLVSKGRPRKIER